MVAAAPFVHANPSFANFEAPHGTAVRCRGTCPVCHDVPETEAVPTVTINQLRASRLLLALELGRMQPR
jgi:hypothetical protein